MCRISLKPSSHGHSCWGGSIPELPAQVVEVSLLGAPSALPHGSSRGPGDLAAEGVQIGAPRQRGRGVPELEGGSSLTDREGSEAGSRPGTSRSAGLLQAELSWVAPW